MKFAYADPVYFGCGRLYADEHPDALAWDRLETHAALVRRLSDEWPEGWALSLHTPSLRHILPLCPDDCRVGAWVKPFASFKPNVNPAFCWEPVIFMGGRKLGRDVDTVRDYVSEPIALRTGQVGAKPEAFCWWVFDMLGAQPGDTLDDLYPGSNNVTRAWKTYHSERLFVGGKGVA